LALSEWACKHKITDTGAQNIHILYMKFHPIHDVEAGAWCALHVRKIAGPVIYAETINSDRYVRQILQPFFRKLTNEEKLC
jgi:hypothetical protein